MVKPKPRDLRARVLFKTSPTVRPSHWDLRLVVRLLEQVFPQALVVIMDEWITLDGDVGSDRSPLEVLASKMSVSELRALETEVLSPKSMKGRQGS